MDPSVSNYQDESNDSELPELEELDLDYDAIHSNLKLSDLGKLQRGNNSSLVNHQLTANYYFNQNNIDHLVSNSAATLIKSPPNNQQYSQQQQQQQQQYLQQRQHDQNLQQQEQQVVNPNDDEAFYDYSILYQKQIYVPPLNFSVVENGIYRSGHPIPINFDFLATLNLQTIIYLGDKEDQYEYYKWVKASSIRFHYIKTDSPSEPFVMNNPQSIISALRLVLDKRNFPILIHSNKGKHRVGVLVGIMRKILQGWSLSGIFDEYVKFAAGKGEADLEFVELFNPQLTLDLDYKPDFVRLS